MIERSYFVVEGESPVMTSINEAVQKNRQAKEAVLKFMAEISASRIWSFEDYTFAGACFKADPPEGWRRAAGKEYCVPDLRTSAGRVLKKRTKALPLGIGGLEFSAMLHGSVGGEFEYHSEHAISWTVYEEYAGVYILIVPAGCKVRPPGCRELKISEYWQIREAAETNRSKGTVPQAEPQEAGTSQARSAPPSALSDNIKAL